MAISSFIKPVDRALRARVYEKFKDLIGSSSMTEDSVEQPKEVALRKLAERRSKDVLESMSIWRIDSDPDLKREKRPLAVTGMDVSYTSNTGESKYFNIKAQPIKLFYEVTFYSLRHEVINQIIERYLWWRQDDPNMDMLLTFTDDLPDLSGVPLEMDLEFGKPRDESTVTAQFEQGLYFVITLPIAVESWVFAPSSLVDIRKIFLRTYDESLPATPILLDLTTID
jgi:hypothetical protein